MSRKDPPASDPGKAVLFEDFFTSMLNSVTESAFLMTLEGLVLAANDTVARRLGFKNTQELVGENMYEVLPEEVAQNRRARVEEVVLTGEPAVFEDERSGRRILNSIYPVYDSSGKVSRLSVFGMDITVRRAQEERLSLLGEMVDRAPASITIHDTGGNFIYVNRETLKLHGYTEAEFMALGLKELDVPDSVELIEERMRMIAEKGEASFESAHYHRDGSVIPVRVVAKNLDWKGTPAVMSIATDIRESKRSEQALRESEERFRSYVENAPYGVFVTDASGWYLDVNPAAEAITGYSREELLRMSIPDLIPEDARGHGMEHFSRLLEEGTSRGEVPFLRKDGEKRFWSVSAVALGEGRFLGFADDVTERKKAGNYLKTTLERLRRVTGSVIQVIVMAVESRDPYTAGHQRRVGDLARSIAFEMGIAPEDADGIRIAGIIHDLGKISVPAEILSKPRQLNDTEFALVKEHPRKGYEILKGVDFDWPIAEMIHQHHERIDGSGYPQGLKGDDIIQGARILAVADVVEAMASHRPYRPTMGIDAALEEISSKRGVFYDPDVVDACLRLFTEKNYRFVEA